ncbi:hypothetical protein AVEN_173615-1 [Araneus ventricosus]|uniref:Uncharacterized protein n=1 Tax=Araneus ventricosus TaxID=182803 RepID=A0A4Y2CQX4_ARAVE|nr:hypothetical protein AVEN_173615-1 [Araneus ventricosus]
MTRSSSKRRYLTGAPRYANSTASKPKTSRQCEKPVRIGAEGRHQPFPPTIHRSSRTHVYINKHCGYMVWWKRLGSVKQEIGDRLSKSVIRMNIPLRGVTNTYQLT